MVEILNLNLLFSFIPFRIEYLNGAEYKGTKPCIKVFDGKQNTEIIFNNMFCKKEEILHDLRTLSFIWNELLPDNNQNGIEDKHIEIAEFIGGKRYRNDILTMIYWLQKECDIDNYKLIQLIGG